MDTLSDCIFIPSDEDEEYVDSWFDQYCDDSVEDWIDKHANAD